jgi:endoribonuclease Dicer
MVSNVTLAAVCVSAGLHEHLHYESAALAASIRTYASELKSRQRIEHELAAREHRSPGQYWTEVEPPKVGSGNALP